MQSRRCSLLTVYRGWLVWREFERQLLLLEGVSADALPEKADEATRRQVSELDTGLAHKARGLPRLRPRMPTRILVIGLFTVILGVIAIGSLSPLLGSAAQGIAGPGGTTWMYLAAGLILLWFGKYVTYRVTTTFRMLQFWCELGREAGVG